ncbi:MAG: Gldg family protein [Treponema sp.]|nr:Gldg family protein [Treponema sp.]
MKRLYRNCLFKLLTTPFTYMICGAAVIFAALQFFITQRFFSDAGTSDLHRFFSGIPYACTLAVPALGSFIPFTRNDLSLPVPAHRLTAARILSLLTVTASALALTLPVPIAVSFFGDIEPSTLICGYIGLILYLTATCAFSVASYTAISSTGFAFIVQSLVLAAVNGIHLLAGYVQMGDMLSSAMRAISFAWHFDAAGKGIIDSRDIVFYASVTALLLLSGTLAIEAKRGTIGSFMRRIAILSVAAFVLLAVDSGRIYFRIDTTSAKRFSVSAYSTAIIGRISEPMSITYYRTPSLRNIQPQVRDIEDFLQVYASASDKISYSVVDPSKDGVASRLSAYGIQGQRIQSTGKDTTSYTTVYSAVVISYMGETRTIPFVMSTATLEFNLAEKLDSMMRGNTRYVQVVVGNGLSLEEDYAYITPWLETQGFQAVQTYLPSEMSDGMEESFTLFPNVPLIVLGTSMFTQEDSQALMNFIRGNGKAVIMTAPYTVDIRKDWSVIPLNDYVVYGLQEFGIYARDTITCSTENFKLALYSQTEAGAVTPSQAEYTDYAMWPSLKSQENAVDGMYAFWPSAIDFDADVARDAGMELREYLHTGDDAWQRGKVGGKFVTNPFALHPYPDEGEETGRYTLAVSMNASGERNPSLIVIGDQYSCSTEMIGYSSTQGSIDTRALDFLSNGLLSVSGENALLELKKSAKTNTALYKTSLERLYESRIPVMVSVCAIPLLMLLAVWIAVSIGRKKLNARLLK